MRTGSIKHISGREKVRKICAGHVLPTQFVKRNATVCGASSWLCRGRRLGRPERHALIWLGYPAGTFTPGDAAWMYGCHGVVSGRRRFRLIPWATASFGRFGIPQFSQKTGSSEPRGGFSVPSQLKNPEGKILGKRTRLKNGLIQIRNNPLHVIKSSGIVTNLFQRNGLIADCNSCTTH